MSFCEGLLDGDTLFVDYESFQLANLVNFLGRYLQECLVFAVLLAENYILEGQLGLRKRLDDEGFDLELWKERNLVQDDVVATILRLHQLLI